MLGRGTILAYSEGTTEPYTYTALTKVVSVNPATTMGEIEDVTLDSDFESYLPTLPAAECNFTVRYRPGDAGVKKILSWVGTPTIVHFKLTSVDGSFMTFDGFVKGFTKTYENKTIVDAEVPMRITSLPEYTEAPDPG
jgi:hypothetical protein